MAIIDRSQWKEFLALHPEAHLLQSAEWGELKSAFGWEAVHVLEGKTGAQILFRRLPLGYSFASLPKGPLTDSVPDAAFWAGVDRICRQRKAVFLKVEADGWMERSPALTFDQRLFVQSPQHIQPHSTLVVDLQGDQEI